MWLGVSRRLEQFATPLNGLHRSLPSSSFVAVVEKNDALACNRVIKRAARILSDQPEKRMPPGLIGVMKDLFAKLLEVFADCSDGFSNGLTPLLVESFGVDEFIEWHRTAWVAFRRCDATQEVITNSTPEGKWHIGLIALAMRQTFPCN